MGFLLSKLSATLANFSHRPARILLLGLDAAGKTTILYRLKLNQNVATLPTIGFNVEEVTPVKSVTFVMWDVGGQEKIRPLWRHYYQGCDGVIFVVDSSDVNRIEEARDELFGVLNDQAMEIGVPTLILGNKQDLPNALRSDQLIDRMGLLQLRTNPWYMQEMCAVSGKGLYEGVTEFSRMVKKYQKERKKSRPSSVHT